MVITCSCLTGPGGFNLCAIVWQLGDVGRDAPRFVEPAGLRRSKTAGSGAMSFRADGGEQRWALRVPFPSGYRPGQHWLFVAAMSHGAAV